MLAATFLLPSLIPSLLPSRAGAPVGCPAKFSATRAGTGQTACEAARRPEKRWEVHRRWEVTVSGELAIAQRTISIQSAMLSGFPAANQPFFCPFNHLRPTFGLLARRPAEPMYSPTHLLAHAPRIEPKNRKDTALISAAMAAAEPQTPRRPIIFRPALSPD